jgi:hypothetical protein
VALQCIQRDSGILEHGIGIVIQANIYQPTCVSMQSNSNKQNSVFSFSTGRVLTIFLTSSKSACSQSFVIPWSKETALMMHE